MSEFQGKCVQDCASCGGCSDGGTGGCPGGGTVSSTGGCPGGCPGGGTLYLTEGEIDLLRRFGEIPFWPLCGGADGEDPVSPDGLDPVLLTALSLKGLIRLDYDLPLSNYDYSAAGNCPRRGSMALTAAGQAAVELLEICGVED